MIGRLPEFLHINGRDYMIRTDYRAVLDIFIAFNDPELSTHEQWYVCLKILFIDFENLPQTDWTEACLKAKWFIECGEEEKEGSPKPKTMDWEQDEQLLFSAVNKVAGFETRLVEHLHWWTFVGYFMEIEEGTFSLVLGIRQKKSKGKKLEKWEQEFYNENKKMCVLKTKLSEEEHQVKDELNKLLG